MFQDACKDLLTMIMPIVVAWRTRRGVVKFTVGAGMILNEDGWFVTAGHILQRIDELYQEVHDEDPRKGRRKDQVTDYAILWGRTNAQVNNAVGLSGIDLGLGKLEGFQPAAGYKFPRFRDRDVEQGELLCRAGYPFLEGVEASWAREGGFTFTNLFPIPMFVNEALVSRFVQLDKGTWIETSSPGLKGQSGGPLVDASGLVCGIQVNTAHYPLGFGGRGRDQMLNVGRAVHVKTIRDFLVEHGVNYYIEEETSDE